MKEVAELSYINNKGILYLKWENRLYSVNTMKRSSEIIVENLTEGSYQVSGSNKMVAWQSEEGMAKEKELVLMDLVTGKKKTIQAGNRERIIPIGFMEAFMDEVTVESTPGIGTTVRMKKKIAKAGKSHNPELPVTLTDAQNECDADSGIFKTDEISSATM